MSDIEQTYVYGEVEVKTTGRVSYLTRGARVDVLHEVTPVDGTYGSWKKWVNLSTLYVIRQTNPTGQSNP